MTKYHIAYKPAYSKTAVIDAAGLRDVADGFIAFVDDDDRVLLLITADAVLQIARDDVMHPEGVSDDAMRPAGIRAQTPAPPDLVEKLAPYINMAH